MSDHKCGPWPCECYIGVDHTPTECPHCDPCPSCGYHTCECRA